jgi:hypothetical protein
METLLRRPGQRLPNRLRSGSPANRLFVRTIGWLTAARPGATMPRMERFWPGHPCCRRLTRPPGGPQPDRGLGS